MESMKITAAELGSHPEAYLDAALDGNFVYVEKDGRHVCILSDDNWRLIVEAMGKLMGNPAK